MNGVLFSCVLFFLLQLHCSLQLADTGSGSEASNSIILGTVVLEDGTMAQNTQVKLIHSTYNPVIDKDFPDSLIDTTDVDGSYSFNLSDTGAYNIQALHLTGRARLLHTNIWVENDTIDNLTDTLKAPGTVKVVLPDTFDISNGYLFIEGTDIEKKIDTSLVYLDSVPEGTTPAIYYTNTVEQSQLKNGITVISNDTVSQAAALFIIRNSGTGMVDRDKYLLSKIEEAVFTVEAVFEDEASIADTIGKSIIIISTTVLAYDTIQKVFKDAALPLVNMEDEMLPRLMMTGTVQGTDFGGLSDSTWEIIDPLHPVAGGFSGVVTVYDSIGRIDWGKPGPGGNIIAAIPGDTSIGPVFCYEKGAEMVGMTAPAKRGAFIVDSWELTNFNSDGWLLFKNMLMWLLE